MKRRYCIQEGATAHTANYFINVLNDVLEGRLTDYGLQGPQP
jgi:hypothetical protein